MKVSVNINGKKKLSTRDKKLADKIYQFIFSTEEKANRTKKDNYILPASMPLYEEKSVSGDQDAGYIDIVKREISNLNKKPDSITNQEAVFKQAKYLNTVMNTIYEGEKDNSNSQSSGMAENNSAVALAGSDNINNYAGDRSTPGYSEINNNYSKAAGAGEKGNTFYNDLNRMDRRVKTFAESAATTFKNMWNELISGGKKAKDPWDALWLSLRNTALKRISEMLKSELFGNLFSTGKNEGSSFGLLGTIISGITGLFTGGASGLISKAGADLLSTDKADAINNVNNYTAAFPANSELTSMFKKYADAAENWQREIRVVNDLFENNRGIKAVQDYLSKTKS